MFLKAIILFHILQIIRGSFVYLHDPSSIKLTCNPYGHKITLPCTLEEPRNLSSSLSLLVFWYWSPTEADPYVNGCQLYTNYQCAHNVGDKYIFKFDRYLNSTDVGKLFYRTLDITITNIETIDIGCYFCRPWMNMVPLNETSGVFCLKPESSYQQMLSCKHVRNNTTSFSLSPSLPQTPPPFDGLSVSPSLSPTPTIYDTSPVGSIDTKNNRLALWLYICIALCVVQAVITIILTAVIITFYRRRAKKQRTESNNTTKDTDAATQEHDNSCIPAPVDSQLTNTGQPQFIGTYSLVRPHEHKRTDSPSTMSKQQTDPLMSHNDNAQTIVQTTPPPSTHPTYGTSHVTTCLSLHGSHIYQTLDKYVEELEGLSFLEEEEEEEEERTSTNKDSYDRLFDDPNYSPLCATYISHTSTSVPSSTQSGPLLTKNEVMEVLKYDKLASKSVDTDYSYAYAHMTMKRRKALEKMASSDTAVNNKISEEILRIAELGTYEMDPEFITTLQMFHASQEDVPIEDTPPLPPKSVMKTDRNSGMKSFKNCYQSLDQNTLMPDNSYATLTK